MTGTTDDVAFQLRIWGWAITGDVCEPAARTAERHHDITEQVLFDRTAADLAGSRIDRGSGWEPAPSYWALPAVTEWRVLHGGRHLA